MDGLVKIKRQLSWLKKSSEKKFDFLQLIYAYIFRPKNLYISSKVSFKNNGSIKLNGYFHFGILTNKLAASVNNYGTLHIAKNGKLHLENNVRFASGCKIHVTGLLSVGENTFINANSIIVATKEIIIGSNCAISWNVQILDSDIHTLVTNNLAQENTKPIKIGNNVWIGSNVTILKGVIIEDNAVIAAGTVVTTYVPANVLVAGVPAKIVKNNVSWLP